MNCIIVLRRLFFVSLLLVYTICPAHSVPGANKYRLINDSTGVLSTEEVQKLDQLTDGFRQKNKVSLGIVLVKDIVRNENLYAEEISRKWNLQNNVLIIVADIGIHRYGFYRSENLKNKFPDWVLKKIEQNHLRVHFREKEYYQGLNEAATDLIGIYQGTFNSEQLKRESSLSGFILIVLLILLVFFILIFPLLQFRALKKSHFSSREMDFVSSVLLMNYFGTRGKNVFDNFTHGQGIFALRDTDDETQGGGGVAGTW